MVVRHCPRNGIVHSFHTGVMVTCCKRVNELSVGTFEACACFTTAAKELPNNHLCSNPLLPFGIAEIFGVAGLTIEKRDINRLLLIFTHAIPYR